MEFMDYSRFFFVLALVIGMIWLLGYALKHFGLDKRLRGVTGQGGRLAVSEVLYLDPRRKLVLVRADAREYLLVLTGERVQVIDTLEARHEPS